MEEDMKLKKYEKEQSLFTEWLNEMREKNDAYFEVITEIMPLFIEFSKSHKHKKTILALSAFHTHLSTLKNAIIDLSDAENIYSVKALYRIYLEHWMKGIYIWSRYISEKNDDVGVEYNSLGKIGEQLKYGNSVKQVSIILDAETKNLDVWDTLCKFDPNLSKLNKKEIIENTTKFEYKNIAKYLSDNKAPGADWISMIIPEYSELSSYVHGGPSATEEYAKLYGGQFKAYRGMIRFVFNTCRMFSYSLFMLMLKDIDEQKKKQLIPLLLKLQDKEGII